MISEKLQFVYICMIRRNYSMSFIEIDEEYHRMQAYESKKLGTLFHLELDKLLALGLILPTGKMPFSILQNYKAVFNEDVFITHYYHFSKHNRFLFDEVMKTYL